MDRPLPQVAGVEHRFVDAGGLRMHVAEAGSGDPLVLLHGWPQHWFAWRKLIPPLAESHRVICPDLRGHGWTDAPPHGYEKEQLATDLVALLDALELERVRLVAHDWGGFAGFLACLAAPDRIERYAAMSIITPWYTPPKITPAALARVSYQFVIAAPLLGRSVLQRLPKFIRTIFKRGAKRTDAWTEDELASFVDQFSEAERAAATVQLYRTFQLKELRAIGGGRYADRRLTMPTLAIYGEHDPVISAETYAGTERHCDDFRVEEIRGVGHFPAEEDPQAVLDLLKRFLAGEP